MNKTLMIGVIALLVMSSVFGFSCIHTEDNIEVKTFKSNMNTEALKQDLDNGVTPEAVLLKIKYFSGCN